MQLVTPSIFFLLFFLRSNAFCIDYNSKATFLSFQMELIIHQKKNQKEIRFDRKFFFGDD